MRPYEVMIIFDAGLEEESIRSVLTRSAEVLEGKGSKVDHIDRWGRRRFAYEVNHRLEGYYVLVEASSEPVAMAELDRTLSLADEVVRHKVIRIPEGVAGRGPRPAPDADSEPVTPPATDPTGASLPTGA